MLGGGDEHAVLHQAGGVADARNVADVRFDLEIVEIGAAEDDPGVRGRGQQAQPGTHGGVKSYTINFNG